MEENKDARRCLCWGNVWFPLSWGAFLFLQIRLSGKTALAWALATGTAGLALALPPLWRFARGAPKGTQAFAALTATGAVQGALASFLGSLGRSERAFRLLSEFAPGQWGWLAASVGVALALLGFPAVFALLAAFFRWVFPHLGEALGALSRPERAAGLCLVAGLALAALWALPQTRAFWVPLLDIVYTADNPLSASGDAFRTLGWPENDLRQPLFAAVSAPWVGGPLLVAHAVRPWVPWAPAFAVACAQAVVTVLGALLLARMLRLRGDWARATFAAWLCSGYGMVLFCVQPEQYAFAFAGLMLFLATRHAGLPGLGRLRTAAFVSAAGTLVTSAAAALSVLPWRGAGSLRARLRPWVGAGVAYAFGIVLFMRLDQALSLGDQVSKLRKFSGEGIPFVARLEQWLAFVAMTVRAPEAGPNASRAAWRLAESPDWGLLPGAAVLAATLLCGMALARQAFARVCLGWVAFYFLLLCVGVWGTAENGMALYVPYFAWAFVGLMGGGLAALARRLRREAWLPAAFGALAMVTAWDTLVALARMVAFLSTAWPA